MSQNIESHLVENRVFKPSKEFSKKARIKSMAQYRAMYRESMEKPEKFWAREASELLWQKKWTKVLEWKLPFAKWFVGGKLNISENCLDRHLDGPRRNKAAIIWEGEPGEKRTLTYQQLHHEVCKFANVLKRNRIKKGDRVIIYMPIVPEAAVAMLACTRIGAVHSVVFGGFSAESIKDRINDCQATAVITADGGYRRGAVVAAQAAGGQGAQGTPAVKRVIVLRRANNEVKMSRRARRLVARRDGRTSTPTARPRRSTASIRFTSFTPAARPASRRASCIPPAATCSALILPCKYVFDLRDEDLYWCTADIGWVTGHSLRGLRAAG